MFKNDEKALSWSKALLVSGGGSKALLLLYVCEDCAFRVHAASTEAGASAHILFKEQRCTCQGIEPCGKQLLCADSMLKPSGLLVNSATGM